MKRASISILTILLLCLTVQSASAQKALSYKDGVFELDRGDFYSAFATFKRLAEQGDARSQHDLAVMHMIGYVGKQDFKAAAKWFQRAADQGLARAQYSLGELLESGRSGVQNKVKALQWYWISGILARRPQRRILAKSKVQVLEGQLSQVERVQARKGGCDWLSKAEDRLKLSPSTLSICAGD
ncbi:MAG: hypothetical protein GKS01_02575 [Alphaproteobacteria bacterium]|nr:hypothetical protein [Alphaproteobacteria bacterium]